MEHADRRSLNLAQAPTDSRGPKLPTGRPYLVAQPIHDRKALGFKPAPKVAGLLRPLHAPLYRAVARQRRIIGHALRFEPQRREDPFATIAVYQQQRYSARVIKARDPIADSPKIGQRNIAARPPPLRRARVARRTQVEILEKSPHVPIFRQRLEKQFELVARRIRRRITLRFGGADRQTVFFPARPFIAE